jgi:hypothetical protein
MNEEELEEMGKTVKDSLENFTTADKFIDTIKKYNNSKLESHVVYSVMDFVITNHVEEEALRFLLTYYKEDSLALTMLVSSPGMSLNLYKEYENYFSHVDKLSICASTTTRIYIKQYIIKSLIEEFGTENEFIQICIKQLFTDTCYPEEFVREIMTQLQ